MDLARSVYSRELKITARRALDVGSSQGEIARKCKLSPKLQQRGSAVNHKRVLRMMRQDNLLCVGRRAFLVTTAGLGSLGSSRPSRKIWR